MSEFLKLLYLDKAFISALYEIKTGAHPETKITSSETIHASARIPLFTGGASSVESRTFSISTIGMLDQLSAHINEFPDFADDGGSDTTGYYWVTGIFTVQVVTRSRTERDKVTGKSEKKEIAKLPYFAIEASNISFALLPTDDYFMSGILGLKDLIETVVDTVSIRARALVRLTSSQTSFKQFVAIPLVVYEQ